jgi:hypothetical protein
MERHGRNPSQVFHHPRERCCSNWVRADQTSVVAFPFTPDASVPGLASIRHTTSEGQRSQLRSTNPDDAAFAGSPAVSTFK